jgi:hypothetical protein
MTKKSAKLQNKTLAKGNTAKTPRKSVPKPH